MSIFLWTTPSFSWFRPGAVVFQIIVFNNNIVTVCMGLEAGISYLNLLKG